jgi:hypothetical protein
MAHGGAQNKTNLNSDIFPCSSRHAPPRAARKAVSSQYKASVKAFEAKGTSFKGETQTLRIRSMAWRQKNDPRPTPTRVGNNRRRVVLKNTGLVVWY